jgi:putative acetyltransferase
MQIRKYEIADTAQIVQLFYDTVHQINIHDYTKAQVDAWAPADINIEIWIKSLSSKLTFVAEDGGIIVGFGQLETNGHIDCFYCHKDFQRKGVGTQILEHIESKAKDLGIDKIFTEASITAKPFFERHKFIAIKKQAVERRGQKFINFIMKKNL